MKNRKISVALKVIAAVLAIGILYSGCAASDTRAVTADSTAVVVSNNGSKENKFASSPRKKSDGTKFRIAYVDLDPYDVTGSMLYYVIESLKKDGWITYDSLPVDLSSGVDAGKLVDWLAEHDLGPYIEFDKSANYYLYYQGKPAVKKSLLDHVNNKKDIDLVLAMGTKAGEFVKTLNLNVPTMVYGSLSPVASGIIKSEDDSGNPNLWAQVDQFTFTRQLQFYHDIIHFKNIGMVYNDPIVEAIPDYEKAASADGFNITPVELAKLTGNNKTDKKVYYEKLKAIYENMINVKKVDAYLINTDVITDNSYMKDLFKLFSDAKIPVFVQIGDNYVKNGAFMQVSPRDYRGLGAFVSYTIGAVFNGASLGKLSQKYVSAPYLSINLKVSKSISYTPTFEMLMSCENIYNSD